MKATSVPEPKRRVVDTDVLDQLQLGQPFNPGGLFSYIVVPDVLVRYRGIGPTAKLVWGRLARYVGKEGYAYPSVRTLADDLGLSERQIQRALAELERHGFIRRILRKTPKGDFTSTIYEVLLHPILLDALRTRNTPGQQPRKNQNGDPGRANTTGTNGVVTDMSPGGERYVTTMIKRRLQEKTSSSPPAPIPPSPTPPPSATKSDDDKPRAEKAELIELVREATGEPADRRLIHDITDGLELRGVPLRNYLDDIRPRLGRLKNRPRAGFFLNHAREWRDSRPAQLPQEPGTGHARCSHCRGTGRTQTGYCTCGMGKELERVERRMDIPDLQQGRTR